MTEFFDRYRVWSKWNENNKNYDILKSSGECASTRTLTRNCREEHHEEGTGLKSLRNIILWYIHDDTSIWYLILHQEWTARFETYIIYDMFIICDGDDSSISNLSVTCAFKKSKSVSWTECLVRNFFFLFHFIYFGHFWIFLRYKFGWSMGSASCQREAYNLSHVLHLHQNSLDPQSLNFLVDTLSQHSWKKGLNDCSQHIFQTCVVK